MMTFGAASLLVGAAVAAVSLVNSAVIPFFLAAAVAGIGFGTGFQGAIRSVVPYAAAHERAGVLSIIFVVSYISMGLPAVIAGWMIARNGNLVGTAQIFCAVVMALANAVWLVWFAVKVEVSCTSVCAFVSSTLVVEKSPAFGGDQR